MSRIRVAVASILQVLIGFGLLFCVSGIETCGFFSLVALIAIGALTLVKLYRDLGSVLRSFLRCGNSVLIFIFAKAVFQNASHFVDKSEFSYQAKLSTILRFIPILPCLVCAIQLSFHGMPKDSEIELCVILE